MAHQSLYRRYRPRRFSDVRGQEHVIGALRNAVANGTEGHAYLFSGPRGTGKTSTARILAKALNCPNLVDGEPCAECESCLSIENGSSYDLFELDAASNNGVDAMRDLISRTAVGSPGRTKVYILDEVHMLSPAASNALLKTLEEPPDHVCFVLATTDPQKVLPTIRSRTQHFEFSLLSANELTDYVRWIAQDAGLDIDEEAVAHVVRQGRGSARDTLSTLDMVVAAGGVSDRADSVSEIVAALVERDTGRVLAAVSDAVSQGREPRVLAETLLGTLRDAFLTSVNASLEHLSDADRAEMGDIARALGPATITRALESIGSAIVEMRQAADPRVPLEVALIKLTTPAAGATLDDLLTRIEDLERRVARGVPAAPAGTAPAPAAADPASAQPAAGGPTPAAPPVPPPGGASGPAAIRAQLAARKGDAPATTGAPASRPVPPRPPRPPASPSRGAAPSVPKVPPAVPEPSAEPAPRPNPPAPEPTPADPAPVTSAAGSASAPATGPRPGVDQLAAAMTESVIPTLKGMNKSLFSAGRFVGDRDGVFVFALDNVPDRLLSRAKGSLPDIEGILTARFGTPIRLELTNASGGARATAAPGASHAPAAPASPATAPNPSAPSGPAATHAAPDTPAPRTGGSLMDATPDGDEDDEEYVDIDIDELEDASDMAISGIDKVIRAFPGAVIIEEEQ